MALSCDDAPRHFDAVSLALTRLQAELGAEVLRSIDLVYTPPLRLLCVLHLSPSPHQEQVLVRIQEVCESNHLRLLDTAGKMPSERAAALEAANQSLSLRKSAIVELAPALERFRRFVELDAPSAAPRPRPSGDGLTLSLFYPTGDAFLSRCAKGHHGLFIESEAVLPVGQHCRLSITTGTGQGPLALSARVVHTESLDAAKSSTRRGFGVAFLLPPEERDLFESFRIALERGAAWPDRSGRRHERFPIQLRVTYRDGDETRREYTGNLSRGGVFINSFDPPGEGRELTLQLVAPGQREPISLAAKVTHVIGAEDAAARGVQAGAGVTFTEDPEQVHAKVQAVLASAEVQATRRVLIADDDKFFRAVIGNALRLGGFDVLEAADGKAAALMLVEDGIAVDALLVDLYMPGLTGAELLAELRRAGKLAGTAVIVITGAPLTELDYASLARLGADDVLGKTVSPEVMLERIEAAVGRRGVRPSA